MASLFDRVLIFGGSGQLGNDLRKELSAYSIAAPPHSLVSVEDVDAVLAAFERYRPTLVINTSAFHQLDDCETNPRRAYEVNAFSVDRLASLCALVGAAFAHVSTDYVFAGDARDPYDEQDEPKPICVYGLSKLAGEQLLRRHLDEWFVFRVSGLYGPSGMTNKGVTFIERILRQAEGGQTPRVVDDVSFSPSYTLHVVKSIHEVLRSGAFGLYHVTNAGSCTWFDFATEALDSAGMKREVLPAKDADFRKIARRPMYTALAQGSLRRGGFTPMPDWREGVREYVAQRKSVHV